MLIDKAPHILSTFAMLAIFLGGEFLYSYAVWRRDVRALAWVYGLLEKRIHLPFFGLGFLAAGMVFGLLTLQTGGFDFVEGWLIAAYLLVGLFLVPIRIPLGRLADKAVEAEAGQRPVEDLVREMAASSAVFFFPINAAIFAATILGIVLKPN
jgi:uncharacterized membrane protein